MCNCRRFSNHLHTVTARNGWFVLQLHWRPYIVGVGVPLQEVSLHVTGRLRFTFFTNQAAVCPLHLYPLEMIKTNTIKKESLLSNCSNSCELWGTDTENVLANWILKCKDSWYGHPAFPERAIWSLRNRSLSADDRILYYIIKWDDSCNIYKQNLSSSL